MSKKHRWLADITFEQKFTNEFACVCNEIIFTAKNGGQPCLTLFDLRPLNEDNLDECYYKAAEKTLSGIPAGFPVIYSIMYTEKAVLR